MADDSMTTTGCAAGAHSLRCYWDFTECRWVCRPVAAAAAVESALPPEPAPVRESAPV